MALALASLCSSATASMAATPESMRVVTVSREATRSAGYWRKDSSGAVTYLEKKEKKMFSKLYNNRNYT